MSILLALLSRTWPFLLTGALGLGGGIWVTHTLDGTRYSALQATYAKYQTDVAQANTTAQQAARDALQKQINARLDAEKRNGEITQQLHDAAEARDNAARDAQFVRRLLAAAQAVPAAPGHSGTSTTHQPGAVDPPEPSGDRPIAELLESATAETRQCFEQYHALLAELQPQLRSPP